MGSEKRNAAEIIEIAGELADKFGARAEAHEQAGTFPYENYDDLRESGYHLASLPPEYGGWGAGFGTLTRAQARLGEGCASTALVTAMHLVQVARAQVVGWPPDQLDRMLRGVAEHGYLLNNAASEPATGSPSRGGLPTTTATRTSDGFLLNGRKTFTTGSPVLHYFVISAAYAPDETAKPLSTNFLVERDAPGLAVVETWNSLGMRLTGSHDLTLENVKIGPGALLTSKGKLSPAQAALNGAWALPVAAVYFGIGRAAAKWAASYARDRRPNTLDQPIAALPHIQEKAGQMELALLAAENTLFAVADLADNGEAERNPARLTALVGAAKQLATNRALEAVDLAMRIVGGASLSMALPMQRYYRDVRAGLGNPPMDDVSTIALGKLALGL